MANLFTRFFGRTASEGAAFALGVATGPVLAPAVEEVRNEAWRTHPSRVVDAATAAAIVAEDVERRDWGAAEAEARGLNGERFDALVAEVRNAPGFGELIRILRRHPDGGAEFRHGLRKARLETRWDDLLADLAHERLDPAVIANAIQQGFMANDGILPVTPSTAGGKVPTEPPVALDTLREAEAGGYGPERLKVLARLAGLPPGPEALASMVFRAIIAESDFSRGVGQGHTKNEWADALLEYARQIPTVTNFVQGHLRGWISAAEMNDGAALHGMSAEDVDLLYKVSGRPATTRQAWIGHARGGSYDGPVTGIPPWFLNAVRQSNIRPEWTNLLWAQRHTYPSAFVIRALASDGTFPEPLVETILVESGWKPEWAKLAAAKWAAGGATGATQKWADRARTRLFTATHQEFLDQSIDEATVRANLDAIGVGAGEQDAILRLWEAEAGIYRRELSPAEIRKAYKKTLYTQEVAISELVERGMTPADAETYLASG